MGEDHVAPGAKEVPGEQCASALQPPFANGSSPAGQGVKDQLPITRRQSPRGLIPSRQEQVREPIAVEIAGDSKGFLPLGAGQAAVAEGMEANSIKAIVNKLPPVVVIGEGVVIDLAILVDVGHDIFADLMVLVPINIVRVHVVGKMAQPGTFQRVHLIG